MNIIVSIKQVPDTTEVRIDPKTNTLIREGVPSIINPFDENAIEEGIKLREKFGGKVTVISMGPPQVENALRDAVAMGADEAILLSDRKFAGADTLATAYALSNAIAKISEYDIIMCGKQAIDGDTGQVGPGIAENLNLPQVANVGEIVEISEDLKNMKVKRALEDGYEILELPLPAMITVLKEINEPRLPSLRGKMMAKKKEIPIWSAADIGCDEKRIGLDGSPTQVVKIFSPKVRGSGEMLSGEVEDMAAELVKRLNEIKLV